MCKFTIDDAIEHATDVAQRKYPEGMLCHANPDDGKLDDCIECGRQHEQLAKWLKELKLLKEESNPMLTVIMKDGNIREYYESDFTDYEWRKEVFIVINGTQWVGMFNWDSVKEVHFVEMEEK